MKLLGIGVLVVGLIVGLSLLLAFPTMWLVNYLIAPSALTAVFGISALTFWKAFWLNFLAGILFRSSNTNYKE